MYGQGYVPHNHHFLAFAAAMAGQSATALEAARATAAAIEPAAAEAFPPVQWQGDRALRVARHVRPVGGDPEGAPPAAGAALRHRRWRTTRAAWRSRGSDRGVEARAALDTVRAIEAAVPEDDFRKALTIAGLALEGEMALSAGRPAEAAAMFRRAAAIEDGLGYMEPPTGTTRSASRSGGRCSRRESPRRRSGSIARTCGGSRTTGGRSRGSRSRSPHRDGARGGEGAAAVRRSVWKDADVKLVASRF